MSLQITNLSEVDTARTQELLALFSTWMKERHPEIELSRGVFHDLVLYFNSVLNAALQENVSRVMQSNSLLSITQNPALADTTLVDKVLSNFNLTRGAGASATGEAVVIVNQSVTTQISQAIKFTANGLNFYPARTFTGIPAGSTVTAAGDRVMVPTAEGKYAFKITLTAELAGSSGNISRGTVFTPNIAPSNVSSIYAAADFIKGLDAPTNAEYIAKLADGISAKTIGGRKAFAALIRAQADFQNILHMSIVGFGDSEQMRDQHGIFPVSGGGRVDIYVQSHDTGQRTDQFLTATYIGPARPNDMTNGTLWEIIIKKDDAVSGFYDVTRVAKIPASQNSPYDNGYEITVKNPGWDFTGLTYAPDIQTLEESANTRYKNLTIRFIDTDTQPGALTPQVSKAVYAVTTIGMPLIGQLQDFMSGRDVRCDAADVLIKAAVPCFTSIAFKVRRAANEPDPDFAAMKTAIVKAISKIGFGGQLSSSVISSAAHQYLSGQQSISSMDIFGSVLRPDGKVVYIRDPERITIPDDPSRLVSAKTTVFLTTVDDINIEPEIISGFGD
jgi:hypothetical protein